MKVREKDLFTHSPVLLSPKSSNEMLMALIRDLGTMETTQDQHLISQSKVLVISSNVPTRLFSQWSFRVLNLPASRLEEYETSEPIESLVRTPSPVGP